ncbi:MAG TPA: response regulator [Polyangiaceae bacterium]|jgi:signal transduction histidine kinase
MSAAAQQHWSPLPSKVLVVDDSAANLIALGAVLKPLDVQVVEARSGPEAIDRVIDDTFAVALLDVQMPGMDGFELAQRLRQLQPGNELPILFLTAIHRDELYVKRGYAAGGADYIMKPFDADVLRARVKAFVDLFKQRERLRAREVGERTHERDEALAELSRLLERERAARRDAEIANNAKDEFLATVSHELRTPLNAILGWSMLARDMTHEPQVQRALATIERNARSQMRIIEDVLDIGRIISGKLRLELGAVDLVDPIRGALEAVRPAADAKEVTLATDVAADIGKITADAERLQQVIWNLVSNAIKFTHVRGRVDVTARREASEVVIRITDDGQGIGPEFLPHVFEPFRQADGTTTRRHGGLGLGLAIVKQLVQAHGGSVSVESPGEGKGATFIVQIPARAAPSSIIPTAAEPEAAAKHLEGFDVLVVDDDDDSRALLIQLLEVYGARVRSAASAEEAFRALTERAPSVILSDLSMPEIDGFGLIRRVRALPPEHGGRTPAIAVTAHAKGPLTDGVFAAGFQAHLPKPIEPDQLVLLIRSIAAGVKPGDG